MKINLVLTLFLAAFIGAFAQRSEDLQSKDKIFLLDGSEQEVQLLINEKTKSGKWLFFIDNLGKLDSLSAKQVLGYRDVYGEVYVSKQYGEPGNEQYVFAQGYRIREIDLYKSVNKKEQIIWFKIPTTNQEYYLTETDYKTQLKAIYPTSKNQSAFLKYIPFSVNGISRAVQKLEDKDYRVLMRTQFSLEVGLNRSHFYWTEPSINAQNLKPTSSFLAGLQINIPLNYSQVSLTSGLFYNQLRFVNEYSENNNNRFSFSANQFKIPFLIRYTFQRTSIRPYLATGMVFTLNSSSNFNEFLQVTTDSTLVIDLVKTRVLVKNPVHFAVVAGVSFRLHNQRFVYFESRYNYQIINVPLQSNNLQVVCGITL